MLAQFKRLLPAPDKRFPPEPCPGCPIQGAKRVGARGTPDSPLVIILEAPGTEELKLGAPVCGPSGDLLDKSVPEDFDFDEAYVINAMQCRPPKTDSQQKDKAFKARACAACRSRVLEQIFRYPRKAILALGNWSNSALTADYDFKITQRRGVVYGINTPTGDEIPVVPAVHPAYLLRGAGNLQAFKDDCRLAVDLAFGEGTKIRGTIWEDPDFVLIDTPEKILEWLAQVEAASEEVVVASDIETSGFSFLKDYMLCLGFYSRATGNIAYIVPQYALEQNEVLGALDRVYASDKIRFVWQFGKFDEKFLRRYGVISERSMVHEDTGLLSYALSEATKDHDLDEQAKNDLGAPDHKDMLKRWVKKKSDSYALVPPPVLHDYTAKDLKKTLLVWEHKRPKVAADPHLEKLYVRTLIPVSHLLAQIEEYGIAVDFDYVRINRSGAVPLDVERGLVSQDDFDAGKEIGLENELIKQAEEIEQIVGYKVNPNSPGEVAELLYERYGLKVVIHGKEQTPKDTRKETLAKLPKHPVVKLILQYRSTQKMLSTYVTAIENLAIDGRIHTSFKQHVTTTGRLSSTEPNIQNIPRNPRFRRMYRAAAGMKFMEADYNAAELRMLACLSLDEFLTGIFLDGTRSLHDEVAVSMYGPNFTDDQRIRAKAINFGIPYGRDAFSVAVEFSIPLEEAQRLIDAWFARMPGAAKFLAAQARAATEGRTLITVFGRKRRPGVVSPERIDGLMNEFRNFHMQSPISDFTCHAGIVMLPRLKKEGAHIVNLIHDAALVEYPDDSKEREQQVAGIMKESMEGVPKLWIKTPIEFRVDLKMGTHWGLLQKYKL